MANVSPRPAKSSHTIEKISAGPVTHVRVSGVIDESFSPKAILPDLQGHSILDLGGVRRMSSFGVRQWMQLVKTLPPGAFGVYLINVPPLVVDQLNMVEGFAGVAQVLSLLALYACERCGDERPRWLDLQLCARVIAEGGAPDELCPVCSSAMKPAEIAGEYFDYVRQHPVKNLDPIVDKYMHLLRPVPGQDLAAPVKLLEEDITFVSMPSVIKGDLSVRKLAAGLEGRVVYDFGHVVGVDPAAAPKLFEVLEAASEAAAVFLSRVPPCVLETLQSAPSTPQAGIASLFLPCMCTSCSSVYSQTFEPGEYEEQAVSQKVADRPCPACGGAATVPLVLESLPILQSCRAVDAPVAQIAALELRALGQLVSGGGPPGTDTLTSRTPNSTNRTPARGSSAQTPAVGTAGGSNGLQIVRRIGEGGMAEVFLARQSGLKGFEKYMVVKKVLPQFAKSTEFVERLFAEARANARLTHPNIVQIFDVGLMDGLAYIAMEYIRGPDLKKVLVRIRKSGTIMPIQHALRVVADTAAGLHYAHTFIDPMGKPHPVIHRDVSPHNVLISLDGAVKLSDFGIAKMQEPGESTNSGTFKGKIHYSSPEAIRCLPLDARHDVFSLGIVLYEALAGHLPFRGENLSATLGAVVGQEPADPRIANPSIPDDVCAVVMKALEKQAEDRFQSAGEFGQALEEVMAAHQYRSSAAMVAQYLTELLGDQLAEFTSVAAKGGQSRPGGVVDGTPAGPSRSMGNPNRTPTAPGFSQRPEGAQRTPTPGKFSPRTPQPLIKTMSNPGKSRVGPGPGAAGGGAGSSPAGQTPPPPAAGSSQPANPQALPQFAPSQPPVKHERPPSLPPPPPTDSVGSNPELAVPEAPVHLKGKGGGRSVAVGAGLALVVVAGAGAAIFASKGGGPKLVEVRNLAADEQLYVGGLRVDPRQLSVTKGGAQLIAVAAQGKLRRMGSHPLREDLDLQQLFESSATGDQTATLSVRDPPTGCPVLLDGAAAPGPTPLRTQIQAGRELRLQVQCKGTPAFEAWVLAVPGQTVEVSVPNGSGTP